MPDGTVTFLFSDLEGSTGLLERYGIATGAALQRHHQLFEVVVERHQGVIFETVGDAVYAAFTAAPDALAAAIDAHRALAADPWTEVGGRLACRISIHTGIGERRGSHYFGAPLFRAARLQALAYGEQTVVSAATAALVTGSLPSGAQLIDRGVHRLKDLQEPEHVFELQHPELRTEFPPLKSLDAKRHNLPVQLTAFVGRTAELAAVSELMRGHRMLTLLGPGGMGKTRLALQAAADEIDAYPDGAWFVDLAAITDAEVIPSEIAATLYVREDADVPVMQTLLAHLRDKKLLLVLDNLEQILPAAARPVADLLSQAPEIHVLATSRRPLRIRGEFEYDLAPLTAGSPETTDDVLPDAVALFLARAREIRPDLEVDATTGPLIAAICNRLDGLPLAIELAAARLRLFSLSALHDRLDQRLPVLTGGAVDLPERHQTLRGTIAWSDELLSPDERTLFHRLGAFAGSFSLDSVFAVVPEADPIAVEASIMALLEHSLIRREDSDAEPRFAMLETVREYAREALVAKGDHDDVASLIADYLISLALKLRGQLSGQGQATASQRQRAELSNMRSTLEWLRDTTDGHRLARLAGALGRFWGRAGLSREGRAWVEAAKANAPSDDSDVRAMLYQAEGIVLSDSAPLQSADAMRASAAISEANGNLTELGRTLIGLSNALLNSGETEQSRAVAERGYGVALEANDLRSQAAAIGTIATTDMQQGRIEEAESAFKRAIDLFEACGDIHATVIALGNLGEAAALRGDREEALARHRLGVEAARRSEDPGLLGWELTNLAWAMNSTGQVVDAIPLLLEGLHQLFQANDLRSVLEGFAAASSLLAGLGDDEGSADAWHLASALSRSLNIPLEPWVAEKARAAAGISDPEPGADEADTVTLDAALARVTKRLRALLESHEAVATPPG